MTLRQLQDWFSKNREAILRDFFQFLTFKSISADPAYKPEVLKCANWLGDYLKKIGMQVELWQTSGMPVLFAEYKSADKNAPTLLIYHHYDVQPADPLELWKSDPFSPVVRDGVVYARGAQDNKGQCFYCVTALKALFELTKQVPLNIKLFIEGEEESGSHGTEEAIEKKRERLKADYLLVVDSTLAAAGVPGLTMGVRGIMTMEFLCKNASTDLHSGTFGGIAYNPNRALAQAIAALWDKNGRVKIPHFYDDVAKLDEDQRKLLDLEFDPEWTRSQFGIQALAPEPGFSPKESSWIRPTVEINGMCGGYIGEGFKTVLPAQASAKISCRLVPNQDPEKIYKLLVDYLCAQFPAGFELKATYGHGAPAFRGNFHSPIAKTAAMSYEEVMKKPCRYMLSGGSIPIVAKLAEACGGEATLMGFGLDEDNIHAPNEHFGLDRFEMGYLTMGRIFAHLSEKH